MMEGQNVDVGGRGVRLLTSFGSLALFAAHEGPLDEWVALAFLAVYCVFTAITGWDPFCALFKHLFARFNWSDEVSTPGEIGQYTAMSVKQDRGLAPARAVSRGASTEPSSRRPLSK